MDLRDKLRVAERETLPGPKVEWEASPPPVLHEQLQRRVRLGRRGRRNLRLAAVTWNGLGVDHAVPVLTAYGPVEDLLGAHGPDRLEDLHLLVPDGVRCERDRRLHRDQRGQLEPKVLDHVAQDAPRLVVV